MAWILDADRAFFKETAGVVDFGTLVWSMTRTGLPLILTLCFLGACGESDEPAEPRGNPAADEPGRDRSLDPKIVAFGDSLTAGYGIGLDEAYPAILQKLLDNAGYTYEIVNAGVSGDTSAAGVRRLEWVLEGRDVRVLILALGANDGLRGLPVSEMQKNLAAIVEEAQTRGIAVLLAGFVAPENQKDQYLGEFVAVFPELAREHGIALMPFLLEGVAGDSTLNQADGNHPNAEGARVLARNVFEHLKPLLTIP